MNRSARTTVIIATRNRVERLIKTVAHMEQLDDVAQVIVADNASSDVTLEEMRTRFPGVRMVALRTNLGAFARTIAARWATTPYIAFCDDDTWWLPGSITAGIKVLDAHPRIGVLNACVRVGDCGRMDEACQAMARGLEDDDLPGAPIIFFLAGAALMRRAAFLGCGGYERRLFIGAEETLLSLDFQHHGWEARYLPTMTVRHDPSPVGRDDASRRRLVLRNRLIVAWMRYVPESAWRTTLMAAHQALSDKQARVAFLRALAKLPWAMVHRRSIDRALQQRIDALWGPRES